MVSAVPTPQVSPHYSLIGLMYGQPFVPEPEVHDLESLQQEALAGHIEDFCDCV